MVRVSVIIPHYNDLDNLRRCLDGLARQTIPRDEYEIIVADNNSSIGLAAVRAAAGSTATVILASEQGAGPARNAGVAASTGEVLAFIDSDCRPDPHWLAEGLAAHSGGDIVGGRILVVPAEPDKPHPVEAFEAVFAFRNEHYVRRHGYSGSGNLFVRRSVFTAVGGFRNGVSEDMEWGQRAATRGFPTRYAARVVVGHPARRDWRELSHKFRRVTRESYLLSCERRFGRLWWFVRSWMVLLSPFAHIFRVLAAQELASFGSRAGAIGILFRIRAFRFVEANRLLFSDIFSARLASPAQKVSE